MSVHHFKRLNCPTFAAHKSWVELLDRFIFVYVKGIEKTLCENR
jgi:hypothetical protein